MPENRVRRVLRKVAGQAALLRADPEAFARNAMQWTHPAAFERRLLDLTNAAPMHVAFDPAGARAARLNVLDPAWTPTGMTGGPNTMLNLACRIARAGVAVRLVSTARPVLLDPAWLRAHAAALLGTDDVPPIAIAAADDPARPLPVGPGDVFMANHWSTAEALGPVLPRMAVRKFVYMVQEFEPGFYAWSSDYARAVQTFAMEFWPVVNEAILADFLFAQPFGRLADPGTRDRATVFEPAVDRALFHPGEPSVRRKRLLFYARTTNPRNLFGMGIAALRTASADAAFAGWEFLAIGGRGGVPAMRLSGGHVLRPAPWLGYAGYADLLRSADVLLCPMLSPHTSYPVLEMAACGGLSVTNAFATKTAERLAAISPAILASDATTEGFAANLVRAATLVNAGHARDGAIGVPRDWAVSLDPVAASIAAIVRGAAAV